MTAAFKSRLAARERVVLMNPDHPSPSLVEFIAKLGVDAVMIDAEQGSPDVETVEDMARAARACGLCALVRIFSPEPWVIERYLFRGVHGLVVPRIDAAAQARRLVEDVRYCFPTNHAEKTLIVQVETAQAVAELDEFLAIDGIDAFFVGPVDLAKSLGYRGNYRDPAVMAVLDTTIARIAAAGRPAGMLVTTADVADWCAKGVTLLYNHLNEYALRGGETFRQAAGLYIGRLRPMLFAPPSVVTAELFAALPAQWKAAPADSEWALGQPVGFPTGSMLEGPSFDRDGNLWCVDIINGRVFRISPAGTFALIAEYDGWPNGLKIHRDGRIFIADYKHGLMLLDPVSGKVAPLMVRAGLERFKGLNDLFFAANGDLYFTDQGMTGLHDPSGRVFKLRADGQLSCLLDNVPSPNGLVMNLDETALFVAVTRANAVWRVPLLRNGGIGKVGTYIQLSGGAGPDGLALDAQGRLAIAHVGLGSVWLMSAHGEPVNRIVGGGSPHTTNIAFGGADGQSLFIVNSGRAAILRARLDVPGKPMFSHA